MTTDLDSSLSQPPSREINISELFTSDVNQLLKTNVTACDLLWSLFVAAARSYRYCSILCPFPSQFHHDSDNKDIIQLRHCISSVPKLEPGPEILQSLPGECQELLSWVLLTSNFRLEMKERDSGFRLIKELTGQIMDVAMPHYIFEVIPSPDREQNFERLCNGRKTFHAYHGSRLDNFYSILHNGLDTHLNKVSVFGEGTYLSSELSVSLMYSQGGEGWKNSMLGSKLSCVAVCQMIDDPSVKCQIKEGSTAVQKQRAQASRTTDAVPEKYYVVQNNEVVRVKYLLVYKEESGAPPVSRAGMSWHSWLYDHKFLLLMLAYALLLVAIGIANSRFSINSLFNLYRNLRVS